MGSDVCFDTRVPTDWEMNNLNLIELTAPHWDPTRLEMPIQADSETREMRTIRSIRISALHLTFVSL